MWHYVISDLVAGSLHNDLQPVGKLLAVFGADRADNGAVSGDRQYNRYGTVTAGLDVYLPPRVAALFQSSRTCDLAAVDRERVIP